MVFPPFNSFCFHYRIQHRVHSGKLTIENLYMENFYSLSCNCCYMMCIILKWPIIAFGLFAGASVVRTRTRLYWCIGRWYSKYVGRLGYGLVYQMQWQPVHHLLPFMLGLAFLGVTAVPYKVPYIYSWLIPCNIDEVSVAWNHMIFDTVSLNSKLCGFKHPFNSEIYKLHFLQLLNWFDVIFVDGVYVC
jgi:hypothetical protein